MTASNSCVNNPLPLALLSLAVWPAPVENETRLPRASIGASPPPPLRVALGGAIAAPIAAWAVRYVSPRPLMIGVGCVVIILSIRTIILAIS